MEEMLQDMGKDKNNIAVRRRKRDIRFPILPNPESLLRQHLCLNSIINRIGHLGNMPMQGSMQFDLP